MKPLVEQIEKIHNDLAEIGCKMMWGMTCEELVKKIIEEIDKQTIMP